MAELRDSSMLFSLKGLMDIERHRVEAETAQENERLRRAQAARAEQARLEREAEKLRAIEAERRRICEETSRRAEDARLAALAQAEVERARIDSEAKARRDVLARQHEHERQLAELQQRRIHRRDRVLTLAGVAAVTSAMALAFGIYFGKLLPEQQRLQNEYRKLVSAEQQRADYAERLATEANQREERLEEEVRELKRRLRAAESEPAPATPPSNGARRPLGTAPRRQRSAPGGSQHRPCRDDGDPLNPCFG